MQKPWQPQIATMSLTNLETMREDYCDVYLQPIHNNSSSTVKMFSLQIVLGTSVNVCQFCNNIAAGIVWVLSTPNQLLNRLTNQKDISYPLADSHKCNEFIAHSDAHLLQMHEFQ